MRIDAGLDTGDILLQEQLPIAPEDSSETLAPRLAAIGAELMVKTLGGLTDGSIHPRPQDDSQSSLAPILKKEDGLIDFNRSAADISNRLRGFQPWPGAFTKFRGRNLQVWSARPATESIPRGGIHMADDQLLVGCGQSTALELLEVQPEGKKRMAARDFIHGYRPHDGEPLG